jgi:hypothetical protein
MIAICRARAKVSRRPVIPDELPRPKNYRSTTSVPPRRLGSDSSSARDAGPVIMRYVPGYTGSARPKCHRAQRFRAADDVSHSDSNNARRPQQGDARKNPSSNRQAPAPVFAAWQSKALIRSLAQGGASARVELRPRWPSAVWFDSCRQW